MTNNKADARREELSQLHSGLGLISMKLDACKLQEVTKHSVSLAGRARISKNYGIISTTDYSEIIGSINKYIDDIDRKCICKER